MIILYVCIIFYMYDRMNQSGESVPCILCVCNYDHIICCVCLYYNFLCMSDAINIKWSVWRRVPSKSFLYNCHHHTAVCMYMCLSVCDIMNWSVWRRVPSSASLHTYMIMMHVCMCIYIRIMNVCTYMIIFFMHVWYDKMNWSRSEGKASSALFIPTLHTHIWWQHDDFF